MKYIVLLTILISFNLFAKTLPPGTQIPQKPNVLFIIDDSGSMQWCNPTAGLCLNTWNSRYCITTNLNSTSCKYPKETCTCTQSGIDNSRMGMTKRALNALFNDDSILWSNIRIGMAVFPNYGGRMMSVSIRNADENEGTTNSQRNQMKQATNDINPVKGTPLYSSLYYAKQYFRGETSSTSICNSSIQNCDSPVTNKCQKNYIILFTDGNPNYGEDPTSIATTLAKEGLENENAFYEGIVTIPIGFAGVSVQYIADAVSSGHSQLDSSKQITGAGTSYNSNTEAEVISAFKNIIESIIPQDMTGASPTLIPAFNADEDAIYQSIFKPEESGDLWEGRFYKKILDSNGFAIESHANNWEATDKLPTSPASRKIYTDCYKDTSNYTDNFKAENVTTLSSCMQRYEHLSGEPISNLILTNTSWEGVAPDAIHYKVAGDGSVEGDLELYFEEANFSSSIGTGSNKYYVDGALLMTQDTTPHFYFVGNTSNEVLDCGTTLPEIKPKFCSVNADCTNTDCLKEVSIGWWTVPVSSLFTGASGVCANVGGTCGKHSDCNPAVGSYCGKTFYSYFNKCIQIDKIEKFYQQHCSLMGNLIDKNNNGTTYKTFEFPDINQLGITAFSNSTVFPFKTIKWLLNQKNSTVDIPASLSDYRKLVRYIRGYETYKTTASCSSAGNETLGACDSRHMLADIYNSKAKFFGVPHQTYSYDTYQTFKSSKSNRKGKELLFVGSNDGLLHAFSAKTGEEEFAYIPPNILPLLRDILKESATKPSGIFLLDGTPKIMDIKDGDNWKSVLMMGFGEGGRGIFALDITDVYAGSGSKPKFLWAIYNDSDAFDTSDSKRIFYWFTDNNVLKRETYTENIPETMKTALDKSLTTEFDYSKLDYTWSEPVIAQMGSDEDSTGTFYAVFGAGGTNVSRSGEGTRRYGSSVYMVDVLTGKIKTEYQIDEVATGNIARRTPSTPTILPKSDLAENREMHAIYIADLAGNIWRMDPKAEGQITCSDSNDKCARLFKETAPSNKRYVFKSLALSYEGTPSSGEGSTNLWVYCGTGDSSLEGIKSGDDSENILFAFKDKKWSSKTFVTPISNTDLVKITDNNTTVSSTDKGWYADIGKLKLVGDPSIIDGYIYFTAYDPVVVAASPCDSGVLGKSYLYSYSLFEAKYNPDFKNLTNPNAEESQRAFLGTGVATAPVLKGNSMYFGISGNNIASEKPIFGQGVREKNLLKWDRTNATNAKKTVVPFTYFRELF